MAIQKRQLVAMLCSASVRLDIRRIQTLKRVQKFGNRVVKVVAIKSLHPHGRV